MTTVEDALDEDVREEIEKAKQESKERKRREELEEKRQDTKWGGNIESDE